MKKYAIILSAGKGKRMGTTVAKQYLEIQGKTIIEYTLESFIASSVDEIALVVSEDSESYVKEEIISRNLALNRHSDRIKIVYGGKERYNSVYNALIALDAKDEDIVLIHDGARPLITPKQIEYVAGKVEKGMGCIAAVPVKDTIKYIKENGLVSKTPDRKLLWQIQTPQAFLYKSIKEAYEIAILANDDTITDDSMVMEKYGIDKICVAQLDYENIKITTEEDLIYMEAILKKRNEV